MMREKQAWSVLVLATYRVSGRGAAEKGEENGWKNVLEIFLGLVCNKKKRSRLYALHVVAAPEGFKNNGVG